MNKWAGKHQLSSDQYHKIPDQWQAEALIELHRQLGGNYDLANTPRSALPKDRNRFVANHQAAWYNLADGVRTGDLACIELAVRFIEAHLIVSYSGYARQRLLRALKNLPLDARQKNRLSTHFLHMLEQQDRERRYEVVFPLWQQIIPAEHLSKLRQLVLNHGAEQDRFTQGILRNFFANCSLSQLRQALPE